ncbi:MAG: GNAT family N-acetyltransferase [Verrucomicrobiota bacterium]|nr:GNAT family N-acetyltransferase [Verrucomicrobiota bacterium]
MIDLWYRPALASDARKVWQWRNESATREASLSTCEVPWEIHEVWYAKKIQDAETVFLIIRSEEDCGYVRLDLTGHEGEISVALDPAQRGKGCGTRVIRDVSNLFTRQGMLKMVHAHVKPGNLASLKAFQQAGYQDTGIKEVRGVKCHHFVFKK